MVLPNFSPNEFYRFLLDKGWKRGTSDFVNEDVLVFEKDGETEAMLIPIKKVYWFPFVVKICEDYNITAPEDFTKVYGQLEAMKRKAEIREEEKTNPKP